MKVNTLNEQFVSVFIKDEVISTAPDMGSTWSPHPTMNHIQVSQEGVFKLLADLQVHKAMGPDEIPSKLLKELAEELTLIFTLYFQASLDQGIVRVPEDWKSANVVTIFKKGNRNNPENYRPVSLTSIVCKIWEHIVCSSMHLLLEAHSILTDAQHGFRKRCSCETQLILTIQDLAKDVDSKGQTDVILLDFSKAFYKVSLLRLLRKLDFYDVRGSVHRWTGNFLGGRA